MKRNVILEIRMIEVFAVNKEWFEMHDIRRRKLGKSVWIPLRAIMTNECEGESGHEGYKYDFHGSGSLAVPLASSKAVNNLGWTDIGISHDHCGYVEDSTYNPAERFVDEEREIDGVHLVLQQRSFEDEPDIWHLNQDLVITLGLKREGNSWICPEDGFVEVVRLRTAKNGRPTLMEIKAQYLKDYLCAREMALYVTNFHIREVVTGDYSAVDWENGQDNNEDPAGRWHGQVIPIHEGGRQFGGKMAVIHVERTDADVTDDVPDISGIPSDLNTKGESWERKFEGKKLYRVLGELWQNELIEPGKSSPKIRRDETMPTVFFIIDADGSKVSGRNLIDAGKWLWFKPDVVMSLCHRRGGAISFHSAFTGSVACSPGSEVHFGINELGLVSVYAKDIGLLPEWQQQAWAGYNTSPEGGVAKELFTAQVKALPAETQAPEQFIESSIEFANELSQEKLGIDLFKEHDAIPDLITRIHRFRAVDEPSFISLAKDLARLFVESLDASAMQKIAAPPKKQKWGSLKSLENLLASKFDRDLVREATAALVGIYELRHADAHLTTSKIEGALKLLDVDRSQPYVHQGFTILDRVVGSIYNVSKFLQEWPD